MKNEIGFLAIGQAGGNIGSIFEEKGYNVFYINTSTEDLDTLKQSKFKYHLKFGEGCNKDRGKAKFLLKENFLELSNEIKTKIKEKYIFVIFSTGGGTGSGISPLLIELLLQTVEDVKIGAITILPSEKEPLKAHINSYECMKELADIKNSDLGATFIIDNNKGEAIWLNWRFAKLFNSVIEITNHKSIKGNIDKAELKELLATRGSAIITTLDKNNSDTAKLINSFRNNIFAPLENDKVIKYIGLSAIQSSKIDLTEIQKELGVFVDSFQNVNTEKTVCLLTGLNFPFTKLKEASEMISKNKETIINNINATSINKLDEEINFLKNTKPIADPKKNSNFSDLFSKYM